MFIRVVIEEKRMLDISIAYIFEKTIDYGIMYKFEFKNIYVLIMLYNPMWCIHVGKYLYLVIHFKDET